MTLEDLKYGMYVELRNGRGGIVIIPPFTTQIKIETINSYHYSYNQNLEDKGHKEFDIVKVLDNDKNVIWEREEEIKYPIYKKSKLSDNIVKFDNIRSGRVIFTGKNNKDYTIGEYIDNWHEHTNTKYWEEKNVVYDEERGLFDKQLVWCWDNSNFGKIVGFYDAKNKVAFSRVSGERKGIGYIKYIPYKGEWPGWAKEAYHKLED